VECLRKLPQIAKNFIVKPFGVVVNIHKQLMALDNKIVR